MRKRLLGNPFCWVFTQKTELSQIFMLLQLWFWSFRCVSHKSGRFRGSVLAQLVRFLTPCRLTSHSLLTAPLFLWHINQQTDWTDVKTLYKYTHYRFHSLSDACCHGAKCQQQPGHLVEVWQPTVVWFQSGLKVSLLSCLLSTCWSLFLIVYMFICC